MIRYAKRTRIGPRGTRLRAWAAGRTGRLVVLLGAIAWIFLPDPIPGVLDDALLGTGVLLGMRRVTKVTK